MRRFQFFQISMFSVLLVCNHQISAETLQEVIFQLVDGNPQARVAFSRLQAEQQRIDVETANFWPTIDVAAGVGSQERDTSPQEGGEKYTRKETSVNLTQNLFSGFNTWYRVKSVKKSAQAEHWRLYSTLEDLTLQVINVYMKVLERRELVALAEENLMKHHEIYDQIKSRTAQGISRSSDLIQVRGRQARANANLINALSNLKTAETEYHALLGYKPGNVELPPEQFLIIPETLEDAINLSMQYHPRIKAAKLDAESSEYIYSSARSSYLPSIDAQLDQSWNRNVNGQAGDYHDQSAVLRVSYNLFSGGGDKARLMESAYRAEESRSQKRVVITDVEEYLRVAWKDLQYTTELLKYLAEHEEASKDTVAAYREQFKIGKRTLLDLLDSENELFQSKNSLTSARYQKNLAHYRILAATGQLLKNIKLIIPTGWRLEPVLK